MITKNIPFKGGLISVSSEMITKTVEWINKNTTECSELSRRLSIFDRQMQGS